VCKLTNKIWKIKIENEPSLIGGQKKRLQKSTEHLDENFLRLRLGYPVSPELVQKLDYNEMEREKRMLQAVCPSFFMYFFLVTSDQTVLSARFIESK